MKPTRPAASHLGWLPVLAQRLWIAIPICLWLKLTNGMIELQSMLVEDFEYYAIYESSYSDLAISFLTFKPIEYLCEVTVVLLVTRGPDLLRWAR
jgi:hypothetical protein